MKPRRPSRSSSPSGASRRAGPSTPASRSAWCWPAMPAGWSACAHPTYSHLAVASKGASRFRTPGRTSCSPASTICSKRPATLDCPRVTRRSMPSSASADLAPVPTPPGSLPRGVPLRQWVVTFPFQLRARLAFDAKLLSAVCGVAGDVLLGFYERRLRERAGEWSGEGRRKLQSGTVTASGAGPGETPARRDGENRAEGGNSATGLRPSIWIPCRCCVGFAPQCPPPASIPSTVCASAAARSWR